MSKNFAEEYKNLADEESPDLWNRIEAGLTPKTAAPAENSQPSKGKVITFFRRYRTAAAAAVCVLLILPAIAVIGRTGQKNSSGGVALDNAAPAESEFETTELYDEASAEEPAAAEMWSEGDAGTAGGTAAAAGVDTAEAESADAAEDTAEALEALMDRETERAAGSAEKNASSDALTETAGALAEEEQSEYSESKKMDLQGDRNSSASMSGGLVKTYEKITIKVLGRMEETETDEGIYYGMEAEIIRSSFEELPENTRITIWVSALSSMAYAQGEEYELDLSYDSGRDYPYQVEKNYFS